MEFRTRKIVKSGDLNGGGTLFGGQALAWIDEESAIFAICQLGLSGNIVTKAMSKIDFKAPAKLGDIVELGCAVVRFGNTSITVKCSMRNKSTQQEIITVDEITFVHVNDLGIPVPHGIKNV